MNNRKNNGFVRNPFLYLLIIVAAVTGFQYFLRVMELVKVSKSTTQNWSRKLKMIMSKRSVTNQW